MVVSSLSWRLFTRKQQLQAHRKGTELLRKKTRTLWVLQCCLRSLPEECSALVSKKLPGRSIMLPRWFRDRGCFLRLCMFDGTFCFQQMHHRWDINRRICLIMQCPARLLEESTPTRIHSSRWCFWNASPTGIQNGFQWQIQPDIRKHDRKQMHNCQQDKLLESIERVCAMPPFTQRLIDHCERGINLISAMCDKTETAKKHRQNTTRPHLVPKDVPRSRYPVE